MMKISLQQIRTGFTGGFCYVHARSAMASDGFTILTAQKLRLTGCDVFYDMETLISPDRGEHWSDFRKSDVLVRTPLENGLDYVMGNATPMRHRATETLLLLGNDIIYRDDRVAPAPRPIHTCWSTFDRDKQDWTPCRLLKMPDEERFFACGNGCGQSVELDNGDLLVPVYFKAPGDRCSSSMVMRCSFNGKDLSLLTYGNALTVPGGRGLGEPSVTAFQGNFFLALRNDERGYVARSADGLHYEEPRVLVFDDGQESGNYNTQQHWFRLGGKLYMVYTRRGAGNDHVFRHRAPLFIAEFDPERMCLIRNTEMIAVPERGARLGNFGCLDVDENESWVIAAEWMQTIAPDHSDWKRCMSYGSDNSIFIAQIRTK